MTALHWAVDRGNVSAVEVLLKFGADVNAESKFDKTPLEIASDNARPDIYEMLQNAEQFRCGIADLSDLGFALLDQLLLLSSSDDKRYLDGVL